MHESFAWIGLGVIIVIAIAVIAALSGVLRVRVNAPCPHCGRQRFED